MNQGQLNRLWLVEGDSTSPLAIGINGLHATLVHAGRTVQTMVVESDGGEDGPGAMTYIRKRESVGVNWELWQSCGEV